MNYRDAVKNAMQDLAADPRTVFLGYNVCFGSRAYGTLADIPTERCLETPVAENLMAGLAIGMGLTGLRPVLFYERHDFILNALDALVNHLDKMETLSQGQFQTPVLIRAVVGGTMPLHPGPQHIQDFTEAFRSMLAMPVLDPRTASEVEAAYRQALSAQGPMMIVERRDLYDCA
jgi:pyruvate dehydrogenase E1 component beta subunit